MIEPRCVRRAATIDELRRLLAVSGKRAFVYLVAVLTGLRRKELQQLQWGDVILDAERPHLALRAVTTKSRRADSVPLSPEVVEALQNARPEGWAPEDRVFASIPKSSTFRDDLKRAGIEYEVDGHKLDFHALRTTFGTLLATSKVDIREAMELMRHRDMRLTTRVYTDPKLIDTHGAATKLPRIGGSSPGSERWRATGTNDLVSSSASGPDPDLRMASCMAELCTAARKPETSPYTLPSTQAPEDNKQKCRKALPTSTLRHLRTSKDNNVKDVRNMEAGGIEPPGPRAQLLEEQGLKCPPISRMASCMAFLETVDPELGYILSVWPGLPTAMQTGILAMVRATASRV